MPFHVCFFSFFCYQSSLHMFLLFNTGEKSKAFLPVIKTLYETRWHSPSTNILDKIFQFIMIDNDYENHSNIVTHDSYMLFLDFAASILKESIHLHWLYSKGPARSYSIMLSCIWMFWDQIMTILISESLGVCLYNIERCKTKRINDWCEQE